MSYKIRFINHLNYIKMSNRQTVEPSNRRTVEPSNRQTVKPSNRQNSSLKFFLICIFSFLITNVNKAQFECTVMGSTSPRITDCSQFDLTTDEILCLPDVTFKLAFHFQEDQNGNNFICDPMHPLIYNQPWTSQYAPNLVSLILSHMNSQMSHALIYDGGEIDAKIRFELRGTGECGTALFTYSQGQSPALLPDALNVVFLSNNVNQTTIGGFTNFGASTIYMNNTINDWVYGNQLKRFWVVANTMMHEFGHTRFLDHAYYCGNVCDGIDLDANGECPLQGMCVSNQNNQGTGCGTSQQNLMMGTGGNPSNVTECEFGELWNYIINNDVTFQDFETCDLPPSNDKIVYDENSAIVWDVKKIFTKHVVIKSGTTITVNCEVEMGDDKEIVVEDGAKLIVEGGTITSICEKPWRGIKVYGGSDDYAVEIRAGSTIENAAQGAVSMFHDGGWLLGSGNAHVKIDFSTFNDCNRILALGSFTQDINKSKVTGNVQNGGKNSVTNWNLLNIEVSGNIFNNISESCIVNSGQMFIIDNDFYSTENDIFFPSVSPSISSVIEDNDFHGIDIGIRMLGTSIAEHQIVRNRFHSNVSGVFMDGDCHYVLDDNIFRGTIGGAFINNGLHSNGVINNKIFTNFLGLSTSGTNSGFVLNDNCYQTNFRDNNINGTIGNVQGALTSSGNPSLRPANNCFTHQGSIASPIADFLGNFEPILYIEPDDSPLDDCRDAVIAESNNINFVVKEISNVKLPKCSDSEDPEDPDSPCDPERNMTQVEASLSELDNMKNNLSPSSAEYRIVNDCYENVRSLWLELLFEEGEYGQARSFLSERQDDDSKLLYYQSYMLEKNTAQAKQYLLSINGNSEQLDDFIRIQLLNHERIQSNFEYQLNANQLSEVYTIANKNHPYAAYAKSLYFWITGELLSSEYPPVIKQEPDVQQRSSIGKKAEDNVLVYPIPFNNTLTVDFTQKPSKGSTLIIEDILGRRIVELNDFEQTSVFNTTNWEQGIYSLYQLEDGKVIHYKKLSLVK